MITRLFNALFGWFFSLLGPKKKLLEQESIPVVTYIKGISFRTDRAVFMARAQPFLLVSGTFFNQGDQTISLLGIKITAFDGQNAVGESDTEVIGSHQANLQPGDSQAWEFRMPLTQTSNRIEISTVEMEYAPPIKAPPTKEARIDWDMKVPAGVLVVFRERLHKTQAFGDGTRLFCHLTIEVQNSGRAVKVLKLDLKFLDQNDKVIDTREALAAWTGGPAIEPGERRLVHVISKVPENYSYYAGRVVEVS